jgi:hypothetical protein
MKNLFAVRAFVMYESDDIVSLWTTEESAKEELKKIKRTRYADFVTRYYVDEVRVNRRDMEISP